MHVPILRNNLRRKGMACLSWQKESEQEVFVSDIGLRCGGRAPARGGFPLCHQYPSQWRVVGAAEKCRHDAYLKRLRCPGDGSSRVFACISGDGARCQCG